MFFSSGSERKKKNIIYLKHISQIFLQALKILSHIENEMM